MGVENNLIHCLHHSIFASIKLWVIPRVHNLLCTLGNTRCTTNIRAALTYTAQICSVKLEVHSDKINVICAVLNLTGIAIRKIYLF